MSNLRNALSQMTRRAAAAHYGPGDWAARVAYEEDQVAAKIEYETTAAKDAENRDQALKGESE